MRSTTDQNPGVFSYNTSNRAYNKHQIILFFLLPHVTHVSSGSRNWNNINL